jgi:hypothetical protein
MTSFEKQEHMHVDITKLPLWVKSRDRQQGRRHDVTVMKSTVRNLKPENLHLAVRGPTLRTEACE